MSDFDHSTFSKNLERAVGAVMCKCPDKIRASRRTIRCLLSGELFHVSGCKLGGGRRGQHALCNGELLGLDLQDL